MLSVHVNIMPWLIAVYSRYSLTWVIAKTYVSYRYITISNWVCVCVCTAAAAAAATTITRTDAHVFCGASVYAFEHSQKVNVWIPLMMGSQCVCVKFLRKKRPNARTHTHTGALFLCFAHTQTHSNANLQIFRALTIFSTFVLKFSLQATIC